MIERRTFEIENSQKRSLSNNRIQTTRIGKGASERGSKGWNWWDGSIQAYKLSMSNFVDIIASSKNLYYQLQSFCNNSLGLSPPPHMGAIAVLNLKVAM